MPIRMLNPFNLSATLGLAKIQDEYVLSSIKASRIGGYGGDNQSYGSGDRFHKGNANKRISSTQMDEKRRKRTLLSL